MFLVLTVGIALILQNEIHLTERDDMREKAIIKYCDETNDRLLTKSGYETVYSCKDVSDLELF